MPRGKRAPSKSFSRSNLQNLKRALDSGQNFATELAAVQKVAGNRVDLDGT